MKRKIIHYRMSSFLMIVGCVTAFICFFNSINLYHILITQRKEKDSYNYDRSVSGMYDSMGNDISLQEIFDTNKGIVRIYDLDLFRDYDEAPGLTDVIMCQNEELIYPVVEGNIPKTDDDINRPTVIIGRGLVDNTIYRDGKHYYQLEGVDCEVCAIIGTKGSELFDYKILLYYKGLKNELKTAIDRNDRMQFVIESNGEDVDNVLKDLKNNINDQGYKVALGGGEGITDNEMLTVDDYANNYLIIFLFCMVNIIIVSELWIKARYKEIAIRKVFGYSERRIYRMLYCDMLVIVAVSVCISSIVQMILNHIFREYLLLYSSQIIYYIAYIIFFILVISIIIMIYPFVLLRKQDMVNQLITKCR